MGSKHRRKSKPARRQHPQPAASTGTPTPSDAEHATVPGGELPLAPRALVETTEASPDAIVGEHADEDTPTESSEEVVPSAPCIPTAEPSALSEAPLLSLEESKRVLERLFVTMLASRMSPTQALTISTSAPFDDLLEQVEQSLDGVELLPVHCHALRVVSTPTDGSDSVDVRSLLELASAATFRIELLEFQIRQSIFERAESKSRGKTDVQRVMAKLASSLPVDTTELTAKAFERLLEEKLGVSSGSSLLTKVVFARIIGHPFAHSLPKQLLCSRATFFTAWESSVVDKPLSMDSVEGQLRHLVSTHADLRASFRALDADGSGFISVDEFVTFLQREAHMHYPRGVLDAFIMRFDVDGDGSLSYEEFIAFVSPKQFGIQVLTPFGMFYQATDRYELMGDVVAKIKTRMFWMQHNDLFASSTRTVYKAPLKLKVTDHFILTHHYGTLRLPFKSNDPIGQVLTNGEMVVLVLEPGGNNSTRDDQLPPFEYRLKPNIKRSIPPLLSWSLRETSRDQTAPTQSVQPTPPVKLLLKTQALHEAVTEKAGAPSPDASSSGYEYYEPDNPTEDDDQVDAENPSEGAEPGSENDFDSIGGDESAAPPLCVEDPIVDWDEDTPPPPYDG